MPSYQQLPSELKNNIRRMTFEDNLDDEQEDTKIEDVEECQENIKEEENKDTYKAMIMIANLVLEENV